MPLINAKLHRNDTIELAENRSLTLQSSQNFYIGLTLALMSSFFIGSSFILKKKGLLKLSSNSKPNTETIRASNGGHGYLKEWMWWSGLLTMAVGEICNFVAYMFAPATLVTPLGACSVLISAVMAAYFLDEKLNTIGKIGCFLTAIGSIVMVIHAPKEGQIKTVNELLSKILDIEFISYCLLTMISLLFLIFLFAPRYGNQNILVYILICSILGSYTVMSCKGIALGIKEILAEGTNLSYVYTLVFVLTAASCIIIQVNYLNKSLDVFNTAIVTTVYYVLFTLFVMIASAILFKELLNVSFQDFLGCMCGFSTIVCALCLIHFFKATLNSHHEIEFKSLNTLVSEKMATISNIDSSELNNVSDKSDEQTISDKIPSENEIAYKCVLKSSPKENSEHYFQYTLNNSLEKQCSLQLNQRSVLNNNNEIKDEKDLSFLNYLNFSYNNIRNKYLRKNESFTGYNYKKLTSDEILISNQSGHNDSERFKPRNKPFSKVFKKTNSYSSLYKENISDEEEEVSNLISIGNKFEQNDMNRINSPFLSK